MAVQTETLERALTPRTPGFTSASTTLAAEDLFSLCYQCGLCTGSCRTAYAMKYTPRQVMNLLQLGRADEAVASGSGLLCTACYSCTFRCPRGVPVTDMMAAVKRLNLAEGRGDARTRRFYRAFMGTVGRHGRLEEVEFLLRYFAPAPVSLLGQMSMGLTLLRKGKVTLRPQRMQGQKAISGMFRRAAQIEGRA